MLALGLGVVLRDAVERWVTGAEELANVAGQELHLLGDGAERIDAHARGPGGALGRLLDSVADHIGGDLDGRSPGRIIFGARVEASCGASDRCALRDPCCQPRGHYVRLIAKSACWGRNSSGVAEGRGSGAKLHCQGNLPHGEG